MFLRSLDVGLHLPGCLVWLPILRLLDLTLVIGDETDIGAEVAEKRPLGLEKLRLEAEAGVV